MAEIIPDVIDMINEHRSRIGAIVTKGSNQRITSKPSDPNISTEYPSSPVPTPSSLNEIHFLPNLPIHPPVPTTIDIISFVGRHNLQDLIKERDKVMGFRKILGGILLAFLLISPLLPIIDEIAVGGRSWVLALCWAPIILILLSYIEFYCRAEVWHICICRGVILEFSKQPWFMKATFFINLFLIIFVCTMVYVMTTDKDTWRRLLVAFMMFLAMAFTCGLVKEILDLEGSNRIHTLNTFVDLLDNSDILQSQGFRVVHYTNLANWIYQHSKIGIAIPGQAIVTGAINHFRGQQGKFTWNDIRDLPPSRCNAFDEMRFWSRWTWGQLCLQYLKPYMDIDE